jgi:2-aminomuconate deaminase
MSTGGIESKTAPEPVGRYPHARRVGNLLFLSGVGPRERGMKAIPGVTLGERGEVVAYDIEAQTRSVFRNVRAILEEAGSSWDRLVDVTVYLTDMKRDFPAYNRLWAEHFPGDAPCRTTLGITSLPTPIAIELKCIATVGSAAEATVGDPK